MNKTVKLSAILLLSLLSYNCSSAGTNVANDDGGDKKKVKVLIFERSEDGKDVKYKAEYENDKLVTIERNGQKVSHADFDKYSDIISDEVEGIQADKEFDFVPRHHKIMKFKHFPDSTFTADMSKLKDELKKIRKIEIKMDGLDSLKEMDDFEDINIPDIHINMNMDFDKLRADLNKVQTELDKVKTELQELKKKK